MTHALKLKYNLKDTEKKNQNRKTETKEQRKQRLQKKTTRKL